jgi:hypothetical protein
MFERRDRSIEQLPRDRFVPARNDDGEMILG